MYCMYWWKKVVCYSRRWCVYEGCMRGKTSWFLWLFWKLVVDVTCKIYFLTKRKSKVKQRASKCVKIHRLGLDLIGLSLTKMRIFIRPKLFRSSPKSAEVGPIH